MNVGTSNKLVTKKAANLEFAGLAA